MIAAGIDPGPRWAAAVVLDGGADGWEVVDAFAADLGAGSGEVHPRCFLAVDGFASRVMAARPDHVGLEDVPGGLFRPGSSFRMQGLLLAALWRRGATPSLVLPPVWQRAHGRAPRRGQAPVKAWARERAAELGFQPPARPEGFPAKALGDLRDAFLIAVHGLRSAADLPGPPGAGIMAGARHTSGARERRAGGIRPEGPPERAGESARPAPGSRAGARDRLPGPPAPPSPPAVR